MLRIRKYRAWRAAAPNTVWYLLGFGRLDRLDVAEFPAGGIGVDEAERLVRRAPGADRVSGGPEGAGADVVRLRLLLAQALELLEVGRVQSLVPVGMLKPHPKNSDYFSDPTPEKYEEIKRSIAAEGIRDPLKVTPDYTVISGHVRLKIAQELGLTHVPVEIWDVDPERAEYLMIADNEERRYCQDPVKKAKRAEFLKQYWGIRRGGSGANQYAGKNSEVLKEKNSPLKTLDDVAKAVGEEVGNLKKLLKLNDLIAPLQDLVSRGRLAQTAAYSLAFLPPEEQRRLLDVLGESGVCGLSVQEARELRRQLDAERRRVADVEARLRDLEHQLAQAQEGSREAESLRAELARMREENERLKASGPEVVEKVVERVVVRPDPVQEAEIARLREEVARLQARLADAERGRRGEGEFRDVERQLEEKRKELRRLESELSVLEDQLQSRRATVGLLVMLRKLFAPLEKARVEVGERLRTTEFGPLHHLEVQEWIALLEWYLRRLRDLLNVRTGHVIDIAQYRETARDDRR